MAMTLSKTLRAVTVIKLKKRLNISQLVDMSADKHRCDVTT